MNRSNEMPLVLTAQQFQGLAQRYKQLQQSGADERSNPEYARIAQLLRYYSGYSQQQAHQQLQPQQQVTQPVVPSHIPQQLPAQPAQPTQQPSQPALSGVPGTSATNKDVAASSAPPTGPPATANLTEDQYKVLNAQLKAFTSLSHNQPIKRPLRQMIYSSTEKPSTSDDLAISQVRDKIVEGVLFQQDNQPFNRFVVSKSVSDPYSLLVPGPNEPISSRQRLVIPSIMPIGVDPATLLHERERRVRARIANRITELEKLPSTLSDEPLDLLGGTSLKLRALIELKSLRLIQKQRQIREDVVRGMVKGTTLATAVDRIDYRRMKKQSLREAHATVKLERAQRTQREEREKQKHRDYLATITAHGAGFAHNHQMRASRLVKMGASVVKIHQRLEKEEQNRLNKVKQERLNALKANDEEAYMKLVDQAKDTRIHHLLTQTKSFLEKLTGAVVTQKESVVGGDPIDADDVDAMMSGADKDKDEYYNTAHRIREVITEQPRMLVGGKLKDYQVKGLQWMISLYNNRLNGILADEMGLGKTIQTISLVTYLIEKKKQPGPFLVIVPLSTLANWVHEFDKWAPQVVKIVYKGPPLERKRLGNEVRYSTFNVLLTTYEFIIKDKGVLSKPKWVFLIIDEGHRMKNADSKLSQTLMQYYSCRYRLILTGTPLQNNLPELWALLNFILPKIFNSVKTFDDWFNSPFNSQTGQDKIELNEEEQLLIIRRLHKVLRPFLLRRLKKDVEAELPDKVETIIKVRLSALQQMLYEQVRQSKSLKIGEAGGPRRTLLQNLVMQFRKICNHPFVFEEVADKLGLGPEVDETIYRVSGKFELLDRMIPKFKVADHRILMFFQMTAVMNIMEEYLNWKGYQYLRLDGSVKAEDRASAMQKFNAPGSPYFIFLLSTRAGGLGLNLQTADTVIIFDSDWNPHQDLQAQDRAHRIGQTKEVRILRLITSKSIEEHILARAQFKLDMDGKVIQAGKFDQKTSEKEREDFLRALFGMDDEEGGAAGTSEKKKGVLEDDEDKEEEDLNDDELNEIIARNEMELELYRKMDQERYVFEREYYRRKGYGQPLPRLMQEDELPEVLLADDGPEGEAGGSQEFGRGARRRGDVRYNDIGDEEFLEAVESGEDPYAAARRLAASRQAEDADAGGEYVGESEDDEDSERRKKARRGRRPLGDEGDETGSISSAGKSAGGRGRGRPRGAGRGARAAAAPREPAAKEFLDELPKKRKRRRTPSGVDYDKVDTVAPAVRAAMKKAFTVCIETIKAMNVEENGYVRKRCELFLALPSKRDYPSYYQIIAQPISLTEIEKRIHSAHYDIASAFRDDVILMFNNARTFNADGSAIYDDANVMERAFVAKFGEVCPGMMVREEDVRVCDMELRAAAAASSNLTGDDEEVVGRGRRRTGGGSGLPFERIQLPKIKRRSQADGAEMEDDGEDEERRSRKRARVDDDDEGEYEDGEINE
ncbi:SNF2-family ATP dependent chromatin remodeling factor snf21 [Cladochytrium replicatum]|nr:SNF2-family ATP dependent chromatin remodeling factor snf21 [Cladochytrium replicatum]